MDVVTRRALGLSKVVVVRVGSHRFCLLRKLLVATVAAYANIHAYWLRSIGCAVASLAFDICLGVCIDPKWRRGL